MPDQLTSGELGCLLRYMPSGWRERVGSSFTSEVLAGCISHLQALLVTVSTYLPRAILVNGRGVQVGRGEFRYGTALFPDVSGFSALTERFSRERGREGAEEVTFIVNRFLDEVNTVATQHGGDSEDSNEDFLPPIIWDVQVEWMTDTLHFEATVSDDGGVHRVVIAYEEGGEWWRTMDLVRGAVSNLWLGELGVPSHRLNYFVQAVDEAGNVALGANKGLMFEVSPNMLFLPVVFKGG